MCGILGAWQAGDAPGLAERVAATLTCLDHRGPDDRGHYVDERQQGTIALGHTRLSIIDLSEGGHQPMLSADGRAVLVYNGEIYNYRELRSELAASGVRFTSESDSEVLLAAWLTWGPACLRRLVGMFAFVVYDRAAGTLTAARDAFGIKPLFWEHDGDGLIFASEMPALLRLRLRPPHLDRRRAYEYLVHGIQEAGSRSFVEGVNRLAPAHLLRLDLRPGAAPVVERWWEPRITENRAISFSEAADSVREQFLENIRLHLRSDVPIGVALSGGIDSSAIASAMRYLEPDLPIRTFSFVPNDPALSEERFIDAVNEHVGGIAHKVRPGDSDFGESVSELIETQGEPFCTTSMYAQYRVFGEARDSGVPVVLEGQGADETLAGYEGYPGQRMRSLLERGRIPEMARFAARWREWPGRSDRSPWKALVGQLLPDRVYQRALAFTHVDVQPEWLDVPRMAERAGRLGPHRMKRSAGGHGRRVMEVLAQALTDTGLPSLLRYGDRNAMHFSVENRVPYLTIPLVELLLSLPEGYLISTDGETKRVFRAAMRGIVPSIILDRRDKIGFETPMRSWLRGCAPAVRDRLRRSEVDFLRPEVMVRKFDSWLDGSRGGSERIWRMINLCYWAEMFGVR